MCIEVGSPPRFPMPLCLPFRSLKQLPRTRSSQSFEPWRRRDVPRAGRRPRRRAARGRRSVRPSAARRGAGRSAAPAGASPRRVATTSEAIVHGVRLRCECFPGQWASAGDRSRFWGCCGVLDSPWVHCGMHISVRVRLWRSFDSHRNLVVPVVPVSLRSVARC